MRPFPPLIQPVYGNPETVALPVRSGAAWPERPGSVVPGTSPVAFERLVSLYRSNERLLSDLKSLRVRLASARAYLDSPGSNPVLGQARVLHLKAKHTAALTLLRANRVVARTLLAPRDSSDL
jgi:hypothetical protein